MKWLEELAARARWVEIRDADINRLLAVARAAELYVDQYGKGDTGPLLDKLREALKDKE